MGNRFQFDERAAFTLLEETDFSVGVLQALESEVIERIKPVKMPSFYGLSHSCPGYLMSLLNHAHHLLFYLRVLVLHVDVLCGCKIIAQEELTFQKVLKSRSVLCVNKDGGE